MKKQISDFVYGTQYYRAPTPLPDEWEIDLKDMHKTGIDTIQLRIQWRWNEPAEGKYEFDDIDRLFELAEKYDKKVIIKFMMETAPDYIFRKYDGLRRDMNGNPINYGANGAYYVGGWWPCFENPNVMKKALDFVDVFTRRYKDKETLILWNVWNEPRTRPIGDCGCTQSISHYRKWLKDNYKTIEQLNSFFGKKWESFETIVPPGMPGDYAETFLWRKWAMYAVSQRLKKMYDKVKSIDNSRPVMAHVGACSITQDVAGDGSDDIQNSSHLDFYGCSFPTARIFKNIIDDVRPFIMCDWIRSVSEYFWVYELYPDWGNWFKPVSMADFKLKVWSTLACGTKGIVYWQYRAERLGFENNLAGLVNIDGSFKEISNESGQIRKFIDDNSKFLSSAEVVHDGIGILYSQDSDLINRIENTGGDLNGFNLECGYPYLYKKSIIGAYALFRELGYTTILIDSRKLEDTIKNIKVLYLPESFMLSDEILSVLEAFVKNDGILLTEEGVGLRAPNTWLNHLWPCDRMSELFGVRIIERTSSQRGEKDTMSLFGHQIPEGEFISRIIPLSSEIIGSWSDNSAAATRKGNVLYMGTSLGASFYDNYKAAYCECASALSRILKDFGIAPRYRSPKGVYVRELSSGEKRMFFIFNRTDLKQDLEIRGKEISIKAKDVTVYLA